MTAAAEHAATVTATPTGAGLLEVAASCACGTWTASGTTNPQARRYDKTWLPTRLRALHRDHQSDAALDPAGFDATLAAEWDATLAALQSAS